MKKKHLPGKILLSLLCALEILALTHIAAAFMLKASPVKLAFVLAAVGFAASLVLRLRVPKAARAFTIAVTALFIAAGAALAAVLAGYSASAVYAGGDDGKANLFAGKRVLLVVPHQDDELNLMCGAIDEYLRYGSEVYVMYVTNGDNRVPAEQRLNEALAAVAVCGMMRSMSSSSATAIGASRRTACRFTTPTAWSSPRRGTRRHTPSPGIRHSEGGGSIRAKTCLRTYATRCLSMRQM